MAEKKGLLYGKASSNFNLLSFHSRFTIICIDNGYPTEEEISEQSVQYT